MSDLPGPNDPLVLKDGRRIDVTTGRTVKQSSAIPRALASLGDSRSAASPTRRRIEDLGIEAPLLSSLMVVAAFKVCNFDDLDIMSALGTSPEMMLAVESHSRYKEVYDLLLESVQAASFGDAKNILAMHAPRAAEELVALLDEDDPVLKMSVADKVLDRAGIGRGNDSGTGGGFRIEVVNSSDDKSASISVKVGV